ncbi:MAG: AAA family ATPase [Actinomycetota bacterium]|nr:AAA family ATPase [Actinomycetota bacterium]
MLFKALETKGFGNLIDGRTEFKGGLTAIVGANEAGKTFTIEAIQQALYGDGATTSSSLREHLHKWGSTGSFYVKLEVEHEGKLYLITRDYGEKKNLVLLPDGTEVKDKKKIASVVEGLVGLPSLNSFGATACILQDEAGTICTESSLREILESKLAGAGSDTDALLKKIDKVKTVVITKSGKKGLLVEQRDLAENLEVELNNVRSTLEVLARSKQELQKVARDLSQKEQDLKDSTAAYQGSKKYIEVLEKYQSADKAFDDAQESLSKYRQAAKDVLEAGQAIEIIDKRISALKEEVDKARAFVESEADADRLTKEKNDRNGRIQTVKKLDTEIETIEKAMSSLKVVDDKELRNAKALPLEVESLNAVLQQQVFRIEVRAEEDVSFNMAADGELVDDATAYAHAEANIEFPGMAVVDIKNLTGEEEPIADEIARKREVLKDVLDKYKVQTVEELEKIHTERLEAEREKARLEEKRADLLGTDDLVELEAHLREIETDLAKATERMEGLKLHALPAERLDAKNEEKISAEQEKRAKETLLNKSKGILEVTGEDEGILANAVEEAAKVLAETKATMKELAPYKCTPEEFAKLERKLQELGDAIEKLKERHIVLTERVSSETVCEEDASVLEEKLEDASKKLERLTRKCDVLGVITENLASAREQSIARSSARIESEMARLMSSITNGHYSEVKVGGNLEVSIFSKEKGDYVDLDRSCPLSTGTTDQAYLAARLALLQVITGAAQPPLILDDTFSSYDDMTRKNNAFEVLKSIAETEQILYFTCHSIPGNVRRVDIDASPRPDSSTEGVKGDA